MHLLGWFSAGIPRSMIVGTPGAHGATVTGTQGMGVSTPSAAAVAAATVGFASDRHIPKGRIFIIGAKSRIFAAGGPSPSTGGGATTNDDGAIPKLHFRIAPMLTSLAICEIPLSVQLIPRAPAS